MPRKRANNGPLDGSRANEEITNLQSPELAPYWLTALIESADDAIISKTLEGVITSWNKGAERIFGYTADEVIGKPVTILIPEGHLDEEPTILAQLRAGNRIEHYETVRVRKDGTLIDISLTVSPIRGPHGKILVLPKSHGISLNNGWHAVHWTKLTKRQRARGRRRRKQRLITSACIVKRKNRAGLRKSFSPRSRTN